MLQGEAPRVESSDALAAFLGVITEELRSIEPWDSNSLRRYAEQVPSPEYEPAWPAR